MDPITLGIVTAAVGAIVTVAAKRWVFPFIENCFKSVKNFFTGTKQEDNQTPEREKDEENPPKEEIREKNKKKSITSKSSEITKDSENNKSNESNSNTEISVEKAAIQEHWDISKATDKLVAIKDKLHNGTVNSVPKHYHGHEILGPITSNVVHKEDYIHHIHPHENFDEETDDEETEGR